MDIHFSNSFQLKYKKRVYKMLRLDEKALRTMHSKTNLRKFCDAIQQRNAQKMERYCSQGLDPNFHDTHGETPLTLAAGIPASREVLVQLVGGGAHLDYRNTEGQVRTDRMWLQMQMAHLDDC